MLLDCESCMNRVWIVNRVWIEVDCSDEWMSYCQAPRCASTSVISHAVVSLMNG